MDVIQVYEVVCATGCDDVAGRREAFHGALQCRDYACQTPGSNA